MPKLYHGDEINRNLRRATATTNPYDATCA
jgi:hypothetical protein